MIPRDVTTRLKRWQEGRALRKYVHKLEKEARKPRPKPRPIPDSLKTPLRPDSDGEWQPRSLAVQNSSLLFSKLSFDMRHQIYRMVLGNHCFHIVQKFTRLAFLFCSTQLDASHLDAGCWGIQNSDGTFLSRYWRWRHINFHEIPPREERKRPIMYTTDGDILSLLLTCRIM